MQPTTILKTGLLVKFFLEEVFLAPAVAATLVSANRKYNI